MLRCQWAGGHHGAHWGDPMGIVGTMGWAEGGQTSLTALKRPPPTALAGTRCLGYVDENDSWHPGFSCQPFTFCCGTCHRRFCCTDPSLVIPEFQQKRCLGLRWAGLHHTVLPGACLGSPSSRLAHLPTLSRNPDSWWGQPPVRWGWAGAGAGAPQSCQALQREAQGPHPDHRQRCGGSCGQKEGTGLTPGPTAHQLGVWVIAS